MLCQLIAFCTKIPAEHTWRGNEYAGELQIVHYWDHTQNRFIILSVLLDDTDDVPNKPLEMFIQKWEEQANEKEFICKVKELKKINPFVPIHKETNSTEMKDVWGDAGPNEADWNVYEFIPTFWYCGYDGSLTISPCSDNTYWRIFDLPLKISKDQSERMADLLLNQIDTDDCGSKEYAGYNKTSLTFSRPLQTERDFQSVYCCKSDDYKAEANNHEYWESMWPKDYHGRNGWK